MKAPASTIILTGATGFIGSAVLAEALARGTRVLALARADSDCQRLAELKGYELIRCARLDESGLADRLRECQPTTLIHCAWRGVAGSERQATHQITDNLPLTLASVQLAEASGCSQWIGLGSQAEYGNPNHIIAETEPTRPTTIYGKAKLAAGIAALALCETTGLAGAWLRVFSTYGPGDAPHWMIPSVIREFLSGRAPRVTRCEQKWDYLYVTDAARAILSAAGGRTAGVFNLGSGQAGSLKQIIELIRAELGSALEPEYGAIPYRPDQVMHLQADVSRLMAACGWKPEVPLERGIRQTVAWHRRESGQSGAPSGVEQVARGGVNNGNLNSSR